MSFARNAVGVLFTSAVGIPVGLAVGIVLARFLSPEDRGLYAVATSFAGLAVIFGQLGWNMASIVRLRRASIDPAVVASNGTVLMLTVGLAIFAALALFQPLVSRELLDDAPPIIFFLAIATIPVRLLTTSFAAIARGIGRFGINNVFRFLGGFLPLPCFILVLVVYDGGLAQVFAIALAIQVFLALGEMVAVLRHTGIAWRVDRSEIRESLRFGSKSYAMSLAGHVHQRVDIFMIAYLLADPAQVAFYAIAFGLVRRLRFVPESIAVAAFPELSSLSPSAAASFVCKLSRQATVGIVPVLVVAAVVGVLAIVPVYGSPYQASVAPFLVLLGSFPGLAVWATVARFYIATDRQKVTIGVQVAGIVTNVVLNLLLIPQIGILGAAVGSLVAHTLEGVLLTTAFVRHTGRSFRELFLFTRADIDPYRRRLEKLFSR